MQPSLSRLPSWALDHREEDLRGWSVRDLDGQALGRVTELIVDTDTRRLSELILDDGKHLSAHDTLVGDHELRYAGNGIARKTPRAAEPIAASTPTAAAPATPAAPLPAARLDLARSDIGDRVVPLIEEQVEVGKRRILTGAMHVESHLIEKPFEQDIGLREERVTVQRRKVNQPLSFGDAEARLREGTVEMTATSEYPVVDKCARIVEDVSVGKAASERAVHLRDTVRHTEADIRAIPAGARPAPRMRGEPKRPDTQQLTGDAATIPVVREEMTVGKREYDAGGVRVTTRIAERPIDETVMIREEKFNVQRQTLDRPRAPDDDAYRDRVFDLEAAMEEPYLTKTARVVEEIRIHKDVAERVEHIHDTLRNTEISVTERASSSFDPSLYSDHYRANYEALGFSMDRVAPAYRFGEEMRRRSPETDWSVLEAKALPLWEEKNPGTWERYRSAVRAGWERLDMATPRAAGG